MASDFQYSCFQCVFFPKALIHGNWRFCIGVGVYKWTSSFLIQIPLFQMNGWIKKTVELIVL